MAIYTYPPASLTAGPTSFVKNGSTVTVNKDTVTPANSRPLPVEVLNSSGVGVNPATEAKQDSTITAIGLLAKLTDTQPVSGPLTDTQLRATPVPVSGPLTDTQLRAAAVPVTANAGTNLNTSALALETTQALIKAKTDNLDVALSTIAKDTTLLASNTLIGAVTEAAPATDTASSGLNGRAQRIAQRISSLILLLPTSLGQKLMASSLAVTIASDQTTLTTSSTAGTNLDTNLGAKADTVATTDTGSFSLIALQKKVNQSLTALIAQIPASLGIKTAAASLSIAPASDAIFNVKPKALTNSFAEFPTLSTVQSFSAPANAIGGKIQALSDNTTNVRYQQGGTATTTSGIRLEPGRSEDFIGGSNISVIAESGTCAVSVNWTIQA